MDGQKSKPKTKQKLCKVLWVHKDSFAVDFDGKGIVIQGNIDANKNSIKLRYLGDIGKPDFQVVSYK